MENTNNLNNIDFSKDFKTCEYDETIEFLSKLDMSAPITIKGALGLTVGFLALVGFSYIIAKNYPNLITT